MAKKQLNSDFIRSELSEGSAFFPGYKKPVDSPVQSPVIETPVIQELQSLSQQPEPVISERANARTAVRPTQKRIITRNSFEIYEDQMDSLRELAYREKREGRVGSMSAMVRDAIDKYLKEKTQER
jgi:hypothetical protein